MIGCPSAVCNNGASCGVFANDSDLDGDSLSAVLVSGPAHGTLTLNADGSFIYTARDNYNGSDSFTYKANDGNADTNVSTVSLTISAVNDAPVADAGPDGEALTAHRGVHVLATAERWDEFPTAVKQLFRTKLELRLDDCALPNEPLLERL